MRHPVAPSYKTRPWAMCCAAFFSRGLYQFTTSALSPSVSATQSDGNITACSNVTYVPWILPPEFSLNSQAEVASSRTPDPLQHYNCCFLPHGMYDIKLCCMFTKRSQIPWNHFTCCTRLQLPFLTQFQRPLPLPLHPTWWTEIFLFSIFSQKNILTPFRHWCVPSIFESVEEFWDAAVSHFWTKISDAARVILIQSTPEKFL